jgi:DNA-binding transcriptional LysR family regulator
MIAMHREGRLDLTLVTCEAGADDGEAEILFREKLVWAACAGGVAAERDPLPVSVWEEGCVWRKAGIDGLERQGRAWREAFKSAHISGQRAAILADLAVAPIPASSLGGRIVEAAARHGLPPLPHYALGMLVARDAPAPVRAAADHLRASFARR